MNGKALVALAAVLVALFSWRMNPDAQTVNHPPNGDATLRAILDYISSGWKSLTRSTKTCEGIADPKLVESAIVYVPADLPIPVEVGKLSEQCGANVEHLPVVLHKLGEVKSNGIQPPGLLFLENPYVVPGGRFNEMYGWDSYFIIRGLLRSGQIDLARGMVENFFFEIAHYGAVLNANRTYYLTRSQPPFLSSMVVALYKAEKARGAASRSWLANAYYVHRAGLRNVEPRSSLGRGNRFVPLLRFWRRPSSGRVARRSRLLPRCACLLRAPKQKQPVFG